MKIELRRGDVLLKRKNHFNSRIISFGQCLSKHCRKNNEITHAAIIGSDQGTIFEASPGGIHSNIVSVNDNSIVTGRNDEEYIRFRLLTIFDNDEGELYKFCSCITNAEDAAVTKLLDFLTKKTYEDFKRYDDHALFVADFFSVIGHRDIQHSLSNGSLSVDPTGLLFFKNLFLKLSESSDSYDEAIFNLVLIELRDLAGDIAASFKFLLSKYEHAPPVGSYAYFRGLTSIFPFRNHQISESDKEEIDNMINLKGKVKRKFYCSEFVIVCYAMASRIAMKTRNFKNEYYPLLLNLRRTAPGELSVHLFCSSRWKLIENSTDFGNCLGNKTNEEYDFSDEDISVKEQSQNHHSFLSTTNKKDDTYSMFSCLSLHGLKYYEVKKEGQSIYSSISLYLGMDVSELRELVFKAMENNNYLVNKFTDFESEDGAFNDYLQDLKNGKEWADYIEIQAIMKSLNRPIYTIDNNYNVTNKDSMKEFTGDPLFINVSEEGGMKKFNAFILVGSIKPDVQGIIETLNIKKTESVLHKIKPKKSGCCTLS